jgi:heme A synthase
MNITHQRCFHVLLVATFVSACLAANVDQLFPPNDAARLAAHLILQEPSAITTVPVWAFFTAAGLFLLAVVSTFVGFYRFRPWSRAAAIAVTLLMLIVKAIGGAGVTSGLSASLVGLTCICWGAALGLAFCSPLAERFRLEQP